MLEPWTLYVAGTSDVKLWELYVAGTSTVKPWALYVAGTCHVKCERNRLKLNINVFHWPCMFPASREQTVLPFYRAVCAATLDNANHIVDRCYL